MMGPEKGHLAFTAGHESEASQLLFIRSVRLPAAGTHTTHQSLGHDPDQCGRHHEGLDAHFIEAGDGAGCVIGMQCAENQVTGERGFDRCFRGFQIAGFSHQQHVGVLAHEGPQSRGEVKSLLPVHLTLGDAWKGVLNRILDGGDVDAGVVAFRQE